MVWRTSWKPFPRICILVSLHYFPLRQTDHWETFWLWNAPASHFHMPGTHVGSSGRGRRESWYGGEAKYSVWLNGGEMWPSPPALPPPPSPGVSGRGGRQGSCLGSPTRCRAQCRPGCGGRRIQDGGGQQAQGGGILYWSRRVETLGQDVSEKI